MRNLFTVILMSSFFISMFSGCEINRNNTAAYVTENISESSDDVISEVIGYKTHDYFSDESMYRDRIIRNEHELNDFYKQYGENKEFSEFVEDIDFSLFAVAVEIISLSSGSYDFAVNGAVVSEGIVKFDYRLNSYDIMTDDMVSLYLIAKVPVSALPEEVIPINSGGFEIIPFPRRVAVENEVIDNISDTLVYEEKEYGSWTGRKPFFSKAVFISTEVIRRYYDKSMKCSNGVYEFSIGNLDVTLTKDYISAENELFGEVYREDNIEAIEQGDELLVEINFLREMLSCSYSGDIRLNDEDDFMVKKHVSFLPCHHGSVNVGELDREGYNYYTKGFVKKKPKGDIVAVNMRGNYIYKTPDGNYFLEWGKRYYTIVGEDVGIGEPQ